MTQRTLVLSVSDATIERIRRDHPDLRVVIDPRPRTR